MLTRLVIVQKRSSLLISRNNRLISAEANFLAKDTRDGNDKCSEEESSHDGECEDPLKGDGLGEELTNSESSSQVAESETHSVVLEDDQEEQSIDQDTPDGDVGKDACWQAMSIDGDSSIGVYGNKGPCKWSGNRRSMDQSVVCVVTEVCRREVEEVDHKENLSPPEMGANEKEDESEV